MSYAASSTSTVVPVADVNNNENKLRRSARLQEKNKGARRKTYCRYKGNEVMQRPARYKKNYDRESSSSDIFIPEHLRGQKKYVNQNKRIKSRVQNTEQALIKDDYDIRQAFDDLVKEKDLLLEENKHLNKLLGKQGGGDFNLTQAKTFQCAVNSEMENKFGKLMESELTCVICTEFFIKATSLNCSHTFCSECISVWKEKEKHCPICRTVISDMSPCIIIDNLINKMIENLSKEDQEMRKNVVKERTQMLEKKNEAERKESESGDRLNNRIPVIRSNVSYSLRPVGPGVMTASLGDAHQYHIRFSSVQGTLSVRRYPVVFDISGNEPTREGFIFSSTS